MANEKLSNNRLALLYAHRLYGMKWSDCVKQGWRLVKFRNQLKHGVLRFRYIKTDATIRVAYGTLNPDLIPIDKHPIEIKNSKLKIKNYTAIPYFDLIRNEWRSFRITMLIMESVRPCHAVWVADEE